MKNITIQLFTFDELAPDIQKKVLDDNRDINTDCDWFDFTIDEQKAELDKLGYIDAKIQFSGFSSQGDGACFTASIDVPTIAKRLNIEIPQSFLDWCDDQGASFNVQKTSSDFAHRYSHENTVEAYWDNTYNAPEQFDNLFLDMEKKATADVRELSRGIYKLLDAEYYELVSDQAVKDTILANEYTFEANGTMRNE